MIQYPRKAPNKTFMTDYLRRALLIFSIVCGSFLFVPFVTFAQVTEGIQVKPAIVEGRVSPGDIYRFSLTFTNISSVEKTFFINAQDIKGLDNNGHPVFSQAGETTGYELSSWVNIPQNSFTVKGGETASVQFSVRVPSGASPGSHFGGMFISDQPIVRNSSGASIALRVGSIVSLRIAGDITEDARLRQFATGNFVYGGVNVDLNAKIENRGNVLIRPHGVIDIADMFGRKVTSIEVNDSAAVVFPGGDRTFTAQWRSDSFAFGRYEAIGSFSYGEDGQKTISATTSFWILPLKLIVSTLVGIIAIVLIFYMLIKMYIRKKLMQMGISGKGSDVNFYAQKYQRSGSRLIIFTLVGFVLCVIALSVLFLLFA